MTCSDEFAAMNVETYFLISIFSLVIVRQKDNVVIYVGRDTSAKEGRYVTKNPIMMRRVNVVFKMKPLIVVRRLLLLLFIIIVFLFISR